MRGQLKYAVGRGVHDPASGAAVLRSELINDRGARRRPVSQNPATCSAGELLDQRLGKSFWKGGKRSLEQHATDLPMPGGAVLAGTGGLGDSERGPGPVRGWNSGQR